MSWHAGLHNSEIVVVKTGTDKYAYMHKAQVFQIPVDCM